MLSEQASTEVDATPREVLEFVCDLHAYLALDKKIVRVYGTVPVDADGRGHAVIQASMRGLRSPKQRLSVRLDRWTSVSFESAGPWLADRFVWMRGGFVVRGFRSGTLVTHDYRIRFKGPLGPLIERYLRDWLRQDLGDELRRIKGHFDRRAAGLPPLQVPHQPRGRTEQQESLDRISNWGSFPGGADGV